MKLRMEKILHLKFPYNINNSKRNIKKIQVLLKIVSHRRWRLPWSRSRGPAPSPDSNYGFHAQTRQVETNVENGTSPYSVLNSQSSGPYSVLNTQSAPYTTSAASYSVLETPLPLWGPPPPYSDPNSPARRPQPRIETAESRSRNSKRTDNFENTEGKKDFYYIQSILIIFQIQHFNLSSFYGIFRSSIEIRETSFR